MTTGIAYDTRINQPQPSRPVAVPSARKTSGFPAGRSALRAGPAIRAPHPAPPCGAGHLTETKTPNHIVP